MTIAAYDAYADWYEEFVTTGGADFTNRLHRMIATLVGTGQGASLDLCCGNGFHAGRVRELGWSPVGVDISTGQLRHARGRLPTALADATRLPVAGASVPLVTSMCAHTDLPDYPAVIAEATRVLRPGGRFVHLGMHPCFVGAFADLSGRPAVVVDAGYADRSYRFESWTPHGVRARVGAWHLPLADLLNAVTDAGLRLDRAAEDGPGGVPDVFGFVATKPALA
jgi:SAM-dependent methyltransferase